MLDSTLQVLQCYNREAFQHSTDFCEHPHSSPDKIMGAGRKKMPLKPGHCNTEMQVCVSWGLAAVKSWECAAGGSTQAQLAKHVACPGTCHRFFPSPSDPVCRLLLLLQGRLKVGEHPSFCQTWCCPCAGAVCHPLLSWQALPRMEPRPPALTFMLPLHLYLSSYNQILQASECCSLACDAWVPPWMTESVFFCFPPFHRAWQWGSRSLLDQKNDRCQNLIATYRQIWGHVWLNGKPLAEIVAV